MADRQPLRFLLSLMDTGAPLFVRELAVIYKEVYLFGRLAGGLILAIFLVVASIAVFGLVEPTFPSTGLDPSWRYALNEAVRRKFIFGDEVLFTLGPYGAVYTGMYEPEFGFYISFIRLLLGLALGLGLVCLLRFSTAGIAVLIPILMLWVSFRDCYYFAFSVVGILVCGRYTLLWNETSYFVRNKLTVQISLVSFFIAYSLIVLIKGSFIAGVLLSIVLSVLMLIMRQKFVFAAILLAVFTSALIAFWTLAGQPFAALPGYFASMLEISSGYSQAVSLDSNGALVLAFLLCSVAYLVLGAFDLHRRIGKQYVLIWIGLAGILAIALKSGFVRHEGHASFGVLFIMCGLLALQVSSRIAVAMLVLGAVAWVGFEKQTGASRVADMPARIWRPVERMIEQVKSGNISRAQLNERFDRSKKTIRESNPLPHLVGTVDVYPIDQATVLAHDFAWSPRPVFQSYLAYSPALANRNLEYLQGPRAPDNILFDISPIDNRLPSLEDGRSWPQLLSRYDVASRLSNFLLLRRKAENAEPFFGDVVLDQAIRAGDSVQLPPGTNLWAEVDWRPTLLGKITSLAYKIPVPRIALQMQGDVVRDYRFIPSMGSSGFLISPVVDNVAAFASLVEPNRSANLLLTGLVPRSVKFYVPDTGDMFWESKLQLRVRSFDVPIQSIKIEQFLEPIREERPLQFEGKSTFSGGECIIDEFNGASPAQDVKIRAGLLKIQGWATVAGKDGVAPEAMFITLQDESGRMRFISPRRLPRGDVGAFFGRFEMVDVGFTATVNATKLTGRHKLEIVALHGERSIVCPSRWFVSFIP